VSVRKPACVIKMSFQKRDDYRNNGTTITKTNNRSEKKIINIGSVHYAGADRIFIKADLCVKCTLCTYYIGSRKKSLI